jgi:hypothetical protein
MGFFSLFFLPLQADIQKQKQYYGVSFIFVSDIEIHPLL